MTFAKGATALIKLRSSRGKKLKEKKNQIKETELKSYSVLLITRYLDDETAVVSSPLYGLLSPSRILESLCIESRILQGNLRTASRNRILVVQSYEHARTRSIPPSVPHAISACGGQTALKIVTVRVTVSTRVNILKEKEVSSTGDSNASGNNRDRI